MSKKITVKYKDNVEILAECSQEFNDDGKLTCWKKQWRIFLGKEDDDIEVSDGFHTMEELYDHRIELFIALCKQNDIIDGECGVDASGRSWRSKLHSDGSSFEGWFILGIGRKKGEQITYHLPIDKWEDTNFAETLDFAPEWDGHTSADVLERLRTL